MLHDHATRSGQAGAQLDTDEATRNLSEQITKPILGQTRPAQTRIVLTQTDLSLKWHQHFLVYECRFLQTTWDKPLLHRKSVVGYLQLQVSSRNCKLDIYPRPMNDSSTKITVEPVWRKSILHRPPFGDQGVGFALWICYSPRVFGNAGSPRNDGHESQKIKTLGHCKRKGSHKAPSKASPHFTARTEGAHLPVAAERTTEARVSSNTTLQSLSIADSEQRDGDLSGEPRWQRRMDGAEGDRIAILEPATAGDSGRRTSRSELKSKR